MVILFPIVLVAAVALIARHRLVRPAATSRSPAWRWFIAWAAAGALLTFSFLAGFSIGLFVLPLAAALTIWVARSAPGWAEAVGFAAGLGTMLLLVGLLNRDYSPCPAGGLSLPPGSSSVSCGGLDPAPWLYSGLIVAAASVVAYAALRVPHDVTA